MSLLRSTLVPLACLAASALPAQDHASLGKPTMLTVGDEPIDVLVGHAAPYLFDFDGDGLRDLLVGEFGRGKFDDSRLPASTLEKWGPKRFSLGKLRIYKNRGTNADPRFSDFEYLKAKDQHASVPTT